MSERDPIPVEEWYAEARALFGEDPGGWRFVCPSCGFIASVQDWRDVGAEKQIAFSCVGRARGAGGDKAFLGKGGPCNYAGGGLFRLNPVKVVDTDGSIREVFEFDRSGQKGASDE